MASDIVRFEWLYTPPDLFEERTELQCDRCIFVVDPSCVHTTIEIDTGASTADIDKLRNELHAKLNARFLATQLVEHRTYALSQATTLRKSSSGQADTLILIETAHVRIQEGRVDVLCERADGTTLDTRRDRIDRRNQIVQLAAKHSSNSLAHSLLTSYSTSVSNPRNELVHLYEIRDALAKRFGGEKGVRDALGIARAQWSELGRLADAEPILQGRHSGKHFGTLREATPSELSTARDIARQMISAYLAYLEKA